MPTIDTQVRSNSAVSSGQHQNVSSAKQTIERSTSRALSCLALAFFTLGASSLCVVGAFDYIAPTGTCRTRRRRFLLRPLAALWVFVHPSCRCWSAIGLVVPKF